MNQWSEGIPPADWDDQLFAAGGHFLQSTHWAAVQQALGKPVFYARSENWQCMSVIEKTPGGIRLYAPYGPTAKSAQALKDALSALSHLAQIKNAMYIRMEPVSDVKDTTLVDVGLVHAPKDLQPHYTWVQDLTQEQDALLLEMSPTKRKRWRNAYKKDVHFSISHDPKDIDYLLDMVHTVAGRKHITPHEDNYYRIVAKTLLPRNAGAIYVAWVGSTPIAANLVYDSPTTRYNIHGGSLAEYHQLHAVSALLVHMLLEAKAAGQHYFDFFGIAPPDQPNHPWAGFTEFKKGFGGFMRVYAGTWELPIKKLPYHALKLAHKIKRALK